MSSDERDSTSHPADDGQQILPSGERVYDPRGRVNAAPAARAPRLATLEGARIVVLDNSKWNAGRLLRRTIEQLQRAQGLGDVSFRTKESFSRVASPALVDDIARHADAVLTAIGD